MEKLEPVGRIFDPSSRIEGFAEATRKRAGGGSVQIGPMSFEAIASAIVPVSSGFDKQSGAKWEDPAFVLSRVMTEYGWTLFDSAIVIAGVRKYVVDPSDGFLPLAPGSIDIEAALEFNPEHRELQIYGDHHSHSPLFRETVNEITGLATEYGNGPNSLEGIIPLYTPGAWRRIIDTQLDANGNKLDRPTGMAIITPYTKLWCEGMSVNNLRGMPMDMASVKMLEAIKIAKHLCKEFNIG